MEGAALQAFLQRRELPALLKSLVHVSRRANAAAESGCRIQRLVVRRQAGFDGSLLRQLLWSLLGLQVLGMTGCSGLEEVMRLRGDAGVRVPGSFIWGSE